MKAAVLGAGSWGTTFAKVLADAGVRTTVWARREDVAAAIRDRHENPGYLPGIRLPDLVTATSDAPVALAGAGLVVLAIPSQQLRKSLGAFVPHVPPDTIWVSLMKGIEIGTTRRMSEVICEVAGVAPERVAIVSGPNLAREIAREQPAATVVASVDHDTAVLVQDLSGPPYLRPYTNTDVVGCELGGAVKNVIALAAGMAEGMGFGDNTKASLITRGLNETARLGVRLGADPLTFAGLAGLGDLVATCTSPLSRNRTFGERLGRGMSMSETVRASSGVAEGVKSCEAILDLGRSVGVEMPIVEHVVMAVHGGMPPDDVVKSLMSREVRHERDDPS